MIKTLKNKQIFRKMKEDVKVEDEYHFLFKCQRNLALRREFLNQMESIESGFKNKESKEKVLALFASKNSK